MDLEYKYGKMVLSTLVNGKIIKRVDREHFIMLMEIFMKVNGNMIEQMDMEYINNQME